MRSSHGNIGSKIVQKRIDQLLQTLRCMRKSRPKDKAVRENILRLSDHLKRDAGLDQIPDDR